MKVSLNWLKEFVELPPSTEALVDLLTLAGVEVEGIETRGVSIESVVVAQILESAQHPNADRLSVCKVDDGSGQTRQIVCGAKNYKVGDKVPLALPGAVLPGDFKIKVGKLRGVESEGMMCSASELGLGESHEGLLILPQSAPTGAPLSDLFPADTILDLEITPNRADLLSYRGIAREVAALTGSQLKIVGQAPRLPRADAPAKASRALALQSEVRIDAPEKCSLYTARKISNIRVAPSPAWLRDKLEASGIRAINNIVDITNFVMLEMGQPLHAFDADKLHGGLRIRVAAEGEEFLALDGRAYKLTSDDLLIADEQRGIAIAGVMGGEETGVTQMTTNVLLESACFQPSSIRRTSRKLGFISDSSYRFERGVDAAGVLAASQRASQLFAEIAGGETGELMIGFGPDSPFGFDPARAMEPVENDYTHTVSLRPERCSQVLGATVAPERADEILSSFGLKKQDGDTWAVPSFRQDLTREIDLVEEVSRVFGIENIAGRAQGFYAPSSGGDHAHDRNMRIRRALVSLGFFEARTLALISETALQNQLFRWLPDQIATEVAPVSDTRDEILRVRNPLSEDHVALRPSLVPGLLATLEHNIRNGAHDIRLFEIGRVFGSGGEQEERTHLGLLLTGNAHERSWRDAKPRAADFFDLKAALASLGSLGFGEFEYATLANPGLALSVTIRVSGVHVGHAGQLLPAKARALDLATPVLVAEIDLSTFAAEPPRKRFHKIGKFPAITRDIAMLAPKRVEHGHILEVLHAANEPLLARAELFDLFTDPTGEKIPADQKSLAYSLTYRSAERTLTADEVNAAHARLKERLKAELNVVFRE
jgi:phenylalanyl-tRNA synthetase beta chain